MSTVILGNIEREDEFCHVPGPELNFNESSYFNFFDRSKNFGGFVRCGNRVNEGTAEVTVCLYLPDGSVLFIYKRPKIKDNEGWFAGGLEVVTEKPFEVVTTRYSGRMLVLRDPMAMLDPKRVYSDSSAPVATVQLSVSHKACGPVWGYSADNYWSSLSPKERELRKAENRDNFARNHYELFSNVEGTLVVQKADGSTREFNLSGNGLRDHSWGPRYWHATPSYRFINGSFSSALGFMATITGKGEIRGAIQLGRDRIVRIRGGELRTAYSNDKSGKYWPGTERPVDPDPLRAARQNHERFELVLRADENIILRIVASVTGFMPLRSRRNGSYTYIGEGMTRFELVEHTGLTRVHHDTVGFGMSEYLDQNLKEPRSATSLSSSSKL